MLSELQKEERRRKLSVCVDLLIGKKMNQRQISELTGFPSSTVGNLLRDEKLIREVYNKKDADFIIEEINIYQQNNKHDGLVTGGLNSQNLHGYEKDEDGKFNGSKKH